MKYKVGDTVKVVKARYHFDEQHLGKTGVIEKVITSRFTFNPYVISGIDQVFQDCELELIKEKDMYKQGDVLVRSGHDYELIVQGMIGDIVFSIDSDDESTRMNTLVQLDNDHWHLKTETPTTELTIDQIAEKFDLKPEQVRIKKEN